jgi:hypothetical protein
LTSTDRIGTEFCELANWGARSFGYSFQLSIICMSPLVSVLALGAASFYKNISRKHFRSAQMDIWQLISEFARVMVCFVVREDVLKSAG